MLPLGLLVLGLLIGPLLGVVVDRAVERERFAAEHRCPTCGFGHGRKSLIPVVSWFDRCGNDPTHRQWRYPLVDVFTAGTFAVAGLRFGASFELVPYLLLFAALVAMSVIDLETHLLLNVLTYPTMAAGVLLVLVLSGPNGQESRIWPALVGAAVYFGVLAAAFIAYPPGLGLGDVKLAPTLGLFLGWMTSEVLAAVQLVFYSILLGFLVAGVTGVTINIIRRNRHAEIPMGPFLAASAVAMIALGPVGTAVVAG